MSNFAQLDQILRKALGEVAPAIVCRVEQGDRLLFAQSYGWLDPSTEQQPTLLDTYFDFASLTKLFTTTACLRLIDQGRLALDQPVAELVPAFGGQRMLGGAEDPISKQPTAVDPRWLAEAQMPIDADAITIRHLLTHTSGLAAWRSIYRACGPTPSPYAALRQAEGRARQQAGLAALVAYPFVYPTGRAYIYSDLGLILLGAACAIANGDAHIGQTIERLVTGPLGLEAHFNPAEKLHNQIAPTEFCQWRQRRLRGEVHDENAGGLGGVAGHAGLFGTAADLSRLGRLYLRGGEGLIATELVTECRQEHVCTPEGDRRGLGWMLRSEPNPSCSRHFSRASFGHTGYTGASLWCDPERELTVVLLTNRVYDGRHPQPIAQLRPAVHEAIAQELST
ncbi:MAG: serine hydrolase domain-containing protein [Caldilineaceae bacterium]